MTEIVSVFVVIGENGEYSDRNDWIAGVFTDRAEAEQVVLRQSEMRHANQVEQDAYWERLKVQRQLFFDVCNGKPVPEGYAGPGRDLLATEGVDAFYAEMMAAAGPCPDRSEDHERLYFVEVPLNTWGRYEF